MDRNIVRERLLPIYWQTVAKTETAEFRSFKQNAAHLRRQQEKNVEKPAAAERGSFKVIKGFSASAVTAELAFKMSLGCALEPSSSMPHNIV